MEIPTLAKHLAENNPKAFRKATEEEIEILKSLKLPESIVGFYKEFSPEATISGFVNLLTIDEMKEENLEDIQPGSDVFKKGFVVFASMDGDAFCFDLKSGDDPRIILFGHEEPFDHLTRKELIEDKGKVVAKNLKEFFNKCLDETLDREPKY